jgi:hypothetical protein
MPDNVAEALEHSVEQPVLTDDFARRSPEGPTRVIAAAAAAARC